jgi:hypothetical protein
LLETIKLTFGSLGELPEVVAQAVGEHPFALVVTLSSEAIADELSEFAARLIRFNCKAAYCRGLLRDNLEDAIDMANVLRDLDEDADVRDEHVVLTVSTDDSVEDCLNELNLLDIERCIAIVATQADVCLHRRI